MGENRGIHAKRFESRVKLSHGLFKSRSLNPTDCGFTGPHHISHVQRFFAFTSSLVLSLALSLQVKIPEVPT